MRPLALHTVCPPPAGGGSCPCSPLNRHYLLGPSSGPWEAKGTLHAVWGPDMPLLEQVLIWTNAFAGFPAPLASGLLESLLGLSFKPWGSNGLCGHMPAWHWLGAWVGCRGPVGFQCFEPQSGLEMPQMPLCCFGGASGKKTPPGGELCTKILHSHFAT